MLESSEFAINRKHRIEHICARLGADELRQRYRVDRHNLESGARLRKDRPWMQELLREDFRRTLSQRGRTSL